MQPDRSSDLTVAFRFVRYSAEWKDSVEAQVCVVNKRPRRKVEAAVWSQTKRSELQDGRPERAEKTGLVWLFLFLSFSPSLSMFLIVPSLIHLHPSLSDAPTPATLSHVSSPLPFLSLSSSLTFSFLPDRMRPLYWEMRGMPPILYFPPHLHFLVFLSAFLTYIFSCPRHLYVCVFVQLHICVRTCVSKCVCVWCWVRGASISWD